MNLAARLEAMNKELGTRLLVSESTAQCLDRPDLEPVASVEVRGLSGERPVFSLRDHCWEPLPHRSRGIETEGCS